MAENTSYDLLDPSQAKKINELEETMVLKDESMFLVFADNLTRKMNFLTLIKALSGDNVGVNSEYKFYTTKYIENRLREINFAIDSTQNQFDDYTKMIERIKTKIDISIEKFDKTVNEIDPKLSELEEKLQILINEKCNALANQDTLIINNVNEIYRELIAANQALRDEFDRKFQEITGVIDSEGNITDALYNSLKQDIDDLRNLLNNYVSDLKSNDKSFNDRITKLEQRAGIFDNTITNSYYTKQDIDNLLQQIYERIKVQIISSSTVDGKKVDADNFTEDGLYFITSTAEASNIPSGNTNGLLQVFNMGNGNTPVVKQVWHRYGTINKSDHMMYERTRFNNGTWSTWARYLTDKDIIYGTEIPTALEDGQIYIQYFV